MVCARHFNMLQRSCFQPKSGRLLSSRLCWSMRGRYPVCSFPCLGNSVQRDSARSFAHLRRLHTQGRPIRSIRTPCSPAWASHPPTVLKKTPFPQQLNHSSPIASSHASHERSPRCHAPGFPIRPGRRLAPEALLRRQDRILRQDQQTGLDCLPRTLGGARLRLSLEWRLRQRLPCALEHRNAAVLHLRSPGSPLLTARRPEVCRLVRRRRERMVDLLRLLRRREPVHLLSLRASHPWWRPRTHLRDMALHAL